MAPRVSGAKASICGLDSTASWAGEKLIWLGFSAAIWVTPNPVICLGVKAVSCWPLRASISVAVSAATWVTLNPRISVVDNPAMSLRFRAAICAPLKLESPAIMRQPPGRATGHRDTPGRSMRNGVRP